MEIKDFIIQYNKSPEYDILDLELQQSKGMTEESLKECQKVLSDIKADNTPINQDWLVDTTEKFCKQKAIYNAMLESMEIIEGKNKQKQEGEIPVLLQEALSISFDPNVGHDYFGDFAKQYDFYHKVENLIKFNMNSFNKMTNGGLPEKTFTCILGGIHVGKTLAMCSIAADYLSQGYDVLYITLEMAQEQIVHRIDANLMNMALKDIKALPKDEYIRKANLLKSKTNGQLIVKEFPTGGASALHFKALLDELRLKKNFKPHIIFIDYINLCMSSRLKPGTTNSYGYIKAIAEELRGLAVSYVTRIFTATQVNRDGFKSSDIDLTNTAESFGLPATADLMFGIIRTEELDKLGQVLIIQMKNRFETMGLMPRFVIGVDLVKMKLFDVEAEAQKDLIDPDIGRVVKENKKEFGDFKW